MERPRRTCGCLGQRCQTFLILLMLWFYIPNVFYEIGRFVNISSKRENLKNTIIPMKTYALQLAEYSHKEAVEKELNLNNDLSSLLKDAASITNKNQLEMFQNDLQRVADIVEMVKVEEWQNSLMEAKNFHEEMMAIQKMIKKEMSTTKRLPLKLDVLLYNSIRIIEELKMYLDLRTWSYTAEAEDIERKLENYYISEFKHEIQGDLDFYASENQDELHDEL